MKRLASTLFDCHMHSTHSPDSTISIEQACAAALQQGLKGIIFTDHFDIQDTRFTFDAHQRATTIDEVRSRFPNLEILQGVELDFYTGERVCLHGLCAEYPYDQVLLSVHGIHALWDTHQNHDTVFRRYLDNVLASILEHDDFDVIGHIGVAQRYLPSPGSVMHYADYQEQIDGILKAVIAKGKGIEVNTSGLYASFEATGKPLGKLLPDADVLTRYFELGGTVLTIGSDAHGAENIGRCFAEAAEQLKQIGFTRVAYFKQRKPQWIEL